MDAEILERLARIETHLEALVGNGQPGRLAILEDKMDTLTAAHNRSAGFAAAISAVIAALVSYLGFYMGRR